MATSHNNYNEMPSLQCAVLNDSQQSPLMHIICTLLKLLATRHNNYNEIPSLQCAVLNDSQQIVFFQLRYFTITTTIGILFSNYIYPCWYKQWYGFFPSVDFDMLYKLSPVCIRYFTTNATIWLLSSVLSKMFQKQNKTHIQYSHNTYMVDVFPSLYSLVHYNFN